MDPNVIDADVLLPASYPVISYLLAENLLLIVQRWGDLPYSLNGILDQRCSTLV